MNLEELSYALKKKFHQGASDIYLFDKENFNEEGSLINAKVKPATNFKYILSDTDDEKKKVVEAIVFYNVEKKSPLNTIYLSMKIEKLEQEFSDVKIYYQIDENKTYELENIIDNATLDDKETFKRQRKTVFI